MLLLDMVLMQVRLSHPSAKVVWVILGMVDDAVVCSSHEVLPFRLLFTKRGNGVESITIISVLVHFNAHFFSLLLLSCP